PTMLCVHSSLCPRLCLSFQHTAPTEIYTLSLHDALPISPGNSRRNQQGKPDDRDQPQGVKPGAARLVIWLHPGASLSCLFARGRDRKSTRLNSSHVSISYAVFCLKKKTECYQGACWSVYV